MTKNTLFYSIVLFVFILFGDCASQGAPLLYDYAWMLNGAGDNFYVTNSGIRTNSSDTGTYVAEFDTVDKKWKMYIPKGSQRSYTLKTSLNQAGVTYTNNGLGSMIEIKLKVVAQAEGAGYATMVSIVNPALPSGAGTHGYYFGISADKVGFFANPGGTAYVSKNFNTTSGYNVYQLYVTTTGAKLYINGSLFLDGIAETSSGATPRLEVGINNSIGGGDVRYEYVAWSNNVIPEPSTLSLAALFAGGVIIWRRARLLRAG